MAVQPIYATPPPDPTPRRRRRDVALWLTFVTAPAVWLGNLQLIYGMVWWSYQSGHTWPMHVAAGVSMLLCAAAGVVAWRAHARVPEADGEAERERAELMAHVAVGAAVLFVLGVMGQWLAVFMVNPKVD